MEEIKNYGVILGQRSTDWIAGAVSGITFEERNPSGDWTPYLPKGEKQFSKFQDSMGCVSFSANNCIETQIKFLTGIEPNFSDRFLAKMSGTTQFGNYLYVVADTVRKVGLVNEEEWPVPPDFTWDSFYSQIPQHIIDKGKDFLAQYDISYEFINDWSRENLMKQLKQSPLQVVIPGHAVMNFYTSLDVQRYFDTYEPFIKEWGTSFNSVLKYVVTKKNMNKGEKIIKILQALEGYNDLSGIAYWGKIVDQEGILGVEKYLIARVPDKIKELENSLK